MGNLIRVPIEEDINVSKELVVKGIHDKQADGMDAVQAVYATSCSGKAINVLNQYEVIDENGNSNRATQNQSTYG